MPGPVTPVGRVAPAPIPAAELAVIEHSGPPADVDRAYGILAAYVARHALAIDGPIREYYLVGQRDTPTPPDGEPRSAGRSSGQAQLGAREPGTRPRASLPAAAPGGVAGGPRETDAEPSAGAGCCGWPAGWSGI